MSGMTWFSRGMGGGWGGGHSSPTASKGGTIGHGLLDMDYWTWTIGHGLLDMDCRLTANEEDHKYITET